MIPAVWVDDGLVAPEDAVVAATDRGVLLGEGIYETCGIIDGSAFALRRHLARLRRSASRIDLPLAWTDHDLREIVAAVVAAACEPPDTAGTVTALAPVTGRLRITVTGGDGPLGPDRKLAVPTLLVMAGPTHQWDGTSNVVIGPWRINEHAPSVGVKATSHLDGVLALRAARAAGADEAVMANSAGVLCEGTGSNVFLVVDGVLSTPSIDTGCLAGITRELVCELLASQGTPVCERNDLSLDDLRRAPEAFLTSSTRNVHPVASVDGVGVGVGAGSVPGPETSRASAALSALQGRDLDP